MVRLVFEALVARESSKRLAKLGETEKNLQMIPRRRMEVVSHDAEPHPETNENHALNFFKATRTNPADTQREAG